MDVVSTKRAAGRHFDEHATDRVAYVLMSDRRQGHDLHPCRGRPIIATVSLPADECTLDVSSAVRQSRDRRRLLRRAQDDPRRRLRGRTRGGRRQADRGPVLQDFLVNVDALAPTIRRRAIFNLIHIAAAVKVDLIVRKELPYRREEFRRCRRVTIDGQEMWIVAPEDLILSKLYWTKESPSELQLRDVRGLLTAVASFDHAYIAKWANHLGIADLLREVQSP